MIHIVNYGMGNVGSISNMLKKINEESCLTKSPDDLNRAVRVILPGVGSFDNAVKLLRDLGYYEKIIEVSQRNVKILGICLGMHLLATNSDEGVLKGLDLIPGNVRKFIPTPNYKVPHMGWNNVTNNGEGLFKELNSNKFYFVHSYYYNPMHETSVNGVTEYGIRFVSSVKKDNIFGVQFHPEKSHKFGMQLLKNFSEL